MTTTQINVPTTADTYTGIRSGLAAAAALIERTRSPQGVLPVTAVDVDHDADGEVIVAFQVETVDTAADFASRLAVPLTGGDFRSEWYEWSGIVREGGADVFVVIDHTDPAPALLPRRVRFRRFLNRRDVGYARLALAVALLAVAGPAFGRALAESGGIVAVLGVAAVFILTPPDARIADLLRPVVHGARRILRRGGAR